MRVTTLGSSMTTAAAVTTNGHHARRNSYCPNLSRLTTASPGPLITTDLLRWTWNLQAPPPSLQGQEGSHRGHGQASCLELVARAHCSRRWYQRTEPQPSPLQSSSPSQRILCRRWMPCQSPVLDLDWTQGQAPCQGRLLTQPHLTLHLLQRTSAWRSLPPR